MPRILVSASFPAASLARQTPGWSGSWDEFDFVFAPGPEPVDGWVVYDDLPEPQLQLCAAGHTLLVTGEPASLRQYRPRFTGQFGRVWTAQSALRHSQVIYGHEGQPWHYGMYASQAHGAPLGYDQLRLLAPPPKPKLLSVICSDKQLTSDQRQRVEFTRFLKRELGDELDVFGRGHGDVQDKADAIWPYRYHIVLENDHSDCFMTEKICDAFLGWSYPIYFGSREAARSFPSGSLSEINIYEPAQALAKIRQLLDRPTYTQALPALAAAREAVLTRHNLMARLANYWRQQLPGLKPRPVRLLPKRHRVGLVARQWSRSLLNSAATF